ncbi:alpha/beta hydrolase [Paucihalobacter ruber]|uniref:Alpha/beta hydrolase n=1 Tax=Paucihalobacter ruber TaxID=2567861 RepID=A0A506PLQ6_9FLAO|nr:alpha/beta hydrolase [Paucihalobacter ruber]TPV34803.1 alpha/beta hydrolase [Paucihalobacter ruber]
MESKYLEYKGIQLHYTDEGKGRTLVFLHGFLENLQMWNCIKVDLIKKYRVVCVDLPGHGKTPCLSYLHTMSDMADTVKAILNNLKLRRYVVFGHSMGGYVALFFAEKYRQNVIGIGLINSTPAADSDEKKRNRERAIVAVKQHKKSFISASIKQLFWEDNHLKLKNVIAQTIHEAHKTSVQGIIAALEGMKIRPDLTEVFLSNATHNLLVKGKFDNVIDHKHLNKICENKLLSCYELKGGHMSYLENNEELSYIIKHYVEKL